MSHKFYLGHIGQNNFNLGQASMACVFEIQLPHPVYLIGLQTLPFELICATIKTLHFDAFKDSSKPGPGNPWTVTKSAHEEILYIP